VDCGVYPRGAGFTPGVWGLPHPSKCESPYISIMATNAPSMVVAILGLRSNLQPIPDELRRKVQSIRVRSLQETRGTESAAWRSAATPAYQGARQSNASYNSRQQSDMGGRWRNSSGNLSQGSQSPNGAVPNGGVPFRFSNSSPTPQSPSLNDRSPRPLQRNQSFQNHPSTPSAGSAPASPHIPARYISRFHNGAKSGDDQILNTVILNKLNVFSIKTYDDVKQFLFQILGSDQKEFIREFTWLVFRKAAAEDKFCGLFAKLLSEIQREYPVILEEMRNLHTTYLDIWNISESPDSTVDRRCRLGYSQFLAELTALGVLESDTMKKTLETLKQCIIDCLPEEAHQNTVDEYMDCLRQLCGTKVPKNVRAMIRELLVDDLEKWIAQEKISAPGLSSKSRFACMDLRDILVKAT
jgi:hypothetical protein